MAAEREAAMAEEARRCKEQSIEDVIIDRLNDIYNIDTSNTDPKQLRTAIAMVLDAFDSQEDFEWFLNGNDERVKDRLDSLPTPRNRRKYILDNRHDPRNPNC